MGPRQCLVVTHNLTVPEDGWKNEFKLQLYPAKHIKQRAVLDKELKSNLRQFIVQEKMKE